MLIKAAGKTVFIFVAAVLLFSMYACSPTVSMKQYDNLQTRYSNVLQEYEQLQSSNELLSANITNCQSEIARLKEDSAKIQAAYDALDDTYTSLIQRIKESKLQNPT